MHRTAVGRLLEAPEAIWNGWKILLGDLLSDPPPRLEKVGKWDVVATFRFKFQNPVAIHWWNKPASTKSVLLSCS